jgi:histidinol dehydrogenase
LTELKPASLTADSSYNGHADSMLRIITQPSEIQTELRRIRSRFPDDQKRTQEATIREILETVKHQGTQALLDYTEKLAQQTLNRQQLRVSGSELDAAYQQISKELLDAIQFACRQLEAFHRQRLPKSWVQFSDDDAVVGRRYLPVERAGLYVPNGDAAHLSLVLLQAIPAKVAQVSEIVMVTPPRADLKIHPGILVAAQEAGIDKIYRLDGVAAIAALAYGTDTVPKVDIITGTGNSEIALAKQMVFGTVGIDSSASSLDLIAIADTEADAAQVAADLLAQAEQDPAAAAILLTPDPQLAEAVQREVHKQLHEHPRRILTEKAIAHYGLIAIADSLEQAAEFSNLFAPQALLLAVSEPWAMLEKIRHAGTIFLGNSTPTAIGRYFGGASAGIATRHASALGVETFMKHSTLVQSSPAALKALSASLQILAQAENLPSQANAVRLRTQAKPLNA